MPISTLSRGLGCAVLLAGFSLAASAGLALAGLAAALWLSPKGWAGKFQHTHAHVWYATIVGSAMDAILATNGEGRITLFNPAALASGLVELASR